MAGWDQQPLTRTGHLRVEYGAVINPFGAKVWLVWPIPLIGRLLGSCLFKVESAPLSTMGFGGSWAVFIAPRRPHLTPGIDPSACALLMD